MEKEIWLEIPGWDGMYQASNLGNIKSLRSNRILAVTLTPLGYGYVSIYKGLKHFKRTVHGLVMRAFVGEPPHGMEINHKDFNRSNNRIDNLEYVTHAVNVKYSWDHGKHTRQRVKRVSGVKHFNVGCNNPQSKLVESEVIEIRELLSKQTHSIAEIARFYNVSGSAIDGINTGSTWKNVGAYEYPIRRGHAQKDVLKPISFLIEGKRKIECPICGKVLSRQGWQGHPCRLVAQKEAA